MIRLTLSFFLALFLFSCDKKNNHTIPENFAKLDGNAAFKLLEKHISYGARISGSDAALSAIEDIKTIADQNNWQFKVDKWREVSHGKQMTFRNVEVVRPGKGREFIIIASHYDTKNLPNFLGVNDGGSSTAVLMQMMLEIAKEEKEWQESCEIRFVFFDGEECQEDYDKISIHEIGGDGLWGSKRYAQNLQKSGQKQNCRGLILLDMVGDKDLGIEIPKNCDAKMAKLALECAEALNYDRFIKQGNREIIDDFVPFNEINLATIDIIDFNYGPQNSFWHTEADTIDKTSAKSLEISGTLSKYLLWQLCMKKEPQKGN